MRDMTEWQELCCRRNYASSKELLPNKSLTSVVCKKAKAKTCQQIMGNLPEERLSLAAPCQFMSVDLFGPYQVKDDIKRRVSMKVWGVLFCCMSSRAIHVELANTLTTKSFLLAYQRFTSVRGHPH